MSVPREFSAEVLETSAANTITGYREFHRSGEPFRSLIDDNPWLRPPKANEPLEWGAGWYYDTTVARHHPDWRSERLPLPTKDLIQLEQDFIDWGYCLIEDGLSVAQCERLHERVEQQAAAERTLGIAHVSAAQQHLWALVNKGEVFVECMQHDAHAVQAGPLIEYLLDAFVGQGWNHLSFISNISFPNCHPQGLHQDQALLAPYVTDVPALVNTIYILQDVDQHNGGTLIIPGSHKLNGASGKHYGKVRRPINLEAPAGTIALTDGRLLHGGAVNSSDKLRYILTNSVVRPWVRQQECYQLTIRPRVLAEASDKFLMRCGFQATASRSMVEGYGYTGSGRAGDPNGDLQKVRQAMDAGDYQWVGELNPAQLGSVQPQQFTLARIQQQETYRGEPLQALIEQMNVD